LSKKLNPKPSLRDLRSKSEARNPKQIQKGGNAARSNQEPALRPLPVLNLQHLDFLNCFGFRDSDLVAALPRCVFRVFRGQFKPAARPAVAPYHNSVCSVCSVV
jgi:hypothetical protein